MPNPGRTITAADLANAIALAARYHRGQTDKRGEPYILHPLRVMNAVREAGYDERFQIVAVCHDLLEDTYCPAAETCMFGKEIYGAIMAITRQFETFGDPLSLPLDEQGARKWGAPKETHREYFLRCVENPIARVVKYFDTLDNMRPERFHREAPYKRYVKTLSWYEENGLGVHPRD